MRTLVTAAASAAIGLTVGLGVTATAGTWTGPRHIDQPISRCQTWHDDTTQQCTVFFRDVKHMRWVAYEAGQWSITVDWFPGHARPTVRTAVVR